MPSPESKMNNFVKKLNNKCFCKFKGLKVEQEKYATEFIARIFFLYSSRNSIYIIILAVIFFFQSIYIILIFPDSIWKKRNVLFGFAIISEYACFSMLSVTRNELSRFFDTSMDIRSTRASFKRTVVIFAQIIFGLVLILLSIQLHFTSPYSPYDIVLTVLSVLITARLIVVIILWSNCAFRFGEHLHELRKFLDKCNGRSEYENLALKMKDTILCLNVLNEKLPIILFLWLCLLFYSFLLYLKEQLPLTMLIFTMIPFTILYLICSFVNTKIHRFKHSTLRLFDLQFITPATNSLINYFWMSQKIENLNFIQVQFLFRATFSNFVKMLVYLFALLISFEPCIKSALRCKSV